MSLCVAREMVVPMAMEAKAAREVMFINMLTAITITNDIIKTTIGHQHGNHHHHNYALPTFMFSSGVTQSQKPNH